MTLRPWGNLPSFPSLGSPFKPCFNFLETIFSSGKSVPPLVKLACKGKANKIVIEN